MSLPSVSPFFLSGRQFLNKTLKHSSHSPSGWNNDSNRICVTSVRIEFSNYLLHGGRDLFFGCTLKSLPTRGSCQPRRRPQGTLHRARRYNTYHSFYNLSIKNLSNLMQNLPKFYHFPSPSKQISYFYILFSKLLPPHKKHFFHNFFSFSWHPPLVYTCNFTFPKHLYSQFSIS